MPARSLRQLAEKLNLSHATVSAALRGASGVKPSTRLKVLAAAAEHGYKANPLASALMGELRRSQGGVFRGALAFLEIGPGTAENAGLGREYDKAIAGAALRRAEELGFKGEMLIVNSKGLEPRRLGEVLDARGIKGVLLLPGAERVIFDYIDWSRLAGICTDCGARGPRLGAVCPDYYQAVAVAMDNLHDLGYARPGVVLAAGADAGVSRRWAAAYLASGDARPASGVLMAGRRDEAKFRAWFEDGGYDVVLAQDPIVREWMGSTGASVPGTHGFCLLNVGEGAAEGAGVDLQAAAIGTRAVDLLTGMILRNESGLASAPVTTLVPAVWRAGLTVRGAGAVVAA